MSESVIIFSREWLMTTALTALLTPAYVLSARPVYGPEQLVRTLREHPRTPLVLGLCLHEHVADLYRLQPLLTRRAVCLLVVVFTGLTINFRNGWVWNSTGSVHGMRCWIRFPDR